MNPAVEPFGDRGILIKFGAAPSAELTGRLAGIAVAAMNLPGVVDAAPGLTSVLIELAHPDLSFLQEALPELLSAAEPQPGDLHSVPVRYDGEDLEWVLEHLGLSLNRFVALHTSPAYDVRMLGSPGFIYLSDVAPELALPRLDTPRRHVSGGSVGIGGRQTGIYGRPRPGGWRIVATAGELPRLRPGDRVRFTP